MAGDIAPYIALITSEHAQAADFVETVGITVQPYADEIETLASLPTAFDLDAAVGAQLDAVGRRVNISRMVGGQNFDDTAFRRLIRATVVANRWNSTKEGAYEAWAALFLGQPYHVIIQDNQDMSMYVAMVGDVPDAITVELFSGGYLRLKPAEVRINFAVPTVDTIPLFGFNMNTANVAGFNVGAWARFI